MEVWTISTARRHSTGTACAVHSTIKVQSLRAHLKYINQCAKSLLSPPCQEVGSGFPAATIPTHTVRPARHIGKGSAAHRHCRAVRAHCCDHVVLGADTQNRHVGGQPLLPALHSWGLPSALLGRTSPHSFQLVSACLCTCTRDSRLTFPLMWKLLGRLSTQQHQNTPPRLNSYSGDLHMQIPDLHTVNQVLSAPAAGASPALYNSQKGKCTDQECTQRQDELSMM